MCKGGEALRCVKEVWPLFINPCKDVADSVCASGLKKKEKVWPSLSQ